MKNDCRTLQRILAAFVLASLVGCGETDGPQPVSGSVKFDDGEVPTGEIAEITFQPATGSESTKGASGSIQPDGSFKLTTFKQGDGALVGDYKVTLRVLESYPRGKLLVAPEFADFRNTPLEATIESGGGTDFNFVVKRP